ncbi:type 2 lanthipeptide synthetase LanM [Candidatus Enterococcus lemimoniae]|uniref:Lantibiotic biosynthesis protein dehydration domain-containing protein n=1 Tax=Candidatus Enterococcus lemimoniae TaxID=1834167 RepID=A0ABZ2T0Q8_9ENTE
MVVYNKKVYPELEIKDYNEHILPIIHYIEKLNLKKIVELPTIVSYKTEEKYPYYNICMSITSEIWDKVWNNKLDAYIHNSLSFKEAICDDLSQVAFSYMIRGFSEGIKLLQNVDLENSYLFYNDILKTNKMKEFSETYFVTWNRCTNLITNRINSIVDTVNRIQQNRIDIEKKFNINRDLKIVYVEADGDTHNDGSSVSIVYFEDKQKIIYKPRSVSGEDGYTKLIMAINHKLDLNLPMLNVINCGYYGFTSFETSDETQIDMYKAGQLACLMYLLNASDMHYSNILWTHKGPLPIDLETLFHPSRNRTGIPESSNSAYNSLEKSVYGTGVLPISISGKNKNDSVDVGFTGIRDKNSVSPFKTFELINGFNSKIKVVWHKSDPVSEDLINDSEYEKKIYQNCAKVVDGFTNLYLLILKNKDSFIKEVITSFKDSKLRYIHNMTYRYEQILRVLTATEPSKNIDTAHSLLSRIGILSMTSDKNIIKSECNQLWKGDIPYFTINFDSVEIYCNNEIISTVKNSPQSEFMRKMEKISQKDLINQQKIIQLAFVAKLADPHAEGKIKLEELENVNQKVIEKKSNEIKKIAETSKIIKWFSRDLLNSVFDDRYEHLPKTWVGAVAKNGNNGWTPGVLGYDLYSGRIGPALVLSILGDQFSDADAKNISNDIFEKSAQILENKSFELRNVLLSGTGAFSGISGLLWAMYQAGVITKNARWKNVAINSWELLSIDLETVENNFFDMINGKSGAIIMRLQIQDTFQPKQEFIDKCVDLAYKKMNTFDDNMTSGVAHGLGHLLWFFSIINQRMKDDKIKKLITDLDNTIRENYTNKEGLIETYLTEQNEHVSSSWCNGLSGLLIAYYEAYKADALPKKSVISIINQLKSIPISCVPVLCHGSLGVLTSLEYVNESFSEETKILISTLKETFCSPTYIYEYFKEGKGRYTLSPGLMSGKSGALLHLCKLVNSDLKISPLILGL